MTRTSERMSPLEFKLWLEKRTARFAVEVFRLLDSLADSPSLRVISFQLGKSASSIGANYHEANRAESKDDFVHKLAIALKEASESAYWLEVLTGLKGDNTALVNLKNECSELRNLLQSIRTSVSRSTNRTTPTLSQSDNQTIRQSFRPTRQSDNFSVQPDSQTIRQPDNFL